MASNPTELFLVLSEMWNSMPDTCFYDFFACLPPLVECRRKIGVGQQSID